MLKPNFVFFVGKTGQLILTGLESGIFICLSQPACGGGNVLLYRTIRDLYDHKGGYNHWLTRSQLATLSYEELLDILSALRRESAYGRAA